jgi:hypothetical protein
MPRSVNTHAGAIWGENKGCETPWSGFHQFKAFFDALKPRFYLDIRLFQPENIALQFVNFIPNADLPLLQIVLAAFHKRYISVYQL